MMTTSNRDPEQALRILRERRSVRKFRPEEIPPRIIKEVIEYATHAPSACNLQSWRFIVVTDPEMKQRIVDAGAAVLIKQAPCGILVAYSNTTDNTLYHDDFQSAAACVQNLLLAAHENGLGACWLCNLPSMSFLRRLFKIPSTYSPIAYVILGYPQKQFTREVPRRNALEDIIGYNCFPASTENHCGSGPALRFRRLLIWIYRKLPVFVKRGLLNAIVDRRLTKKF